MKRVHELCGLYLLSSILVLSVMSCAAEQGPIEGDPEDGKADDLACLGATIDEHGYCRFPNGQFAFEYCCEEEVVCDPAPTRECLFGETTCGTEALGFLDYDEDGGDIPSPEALENVDELGRAQILAGVIADGCDWVEDAVQAFECADSDGFNLKDATDPLSGARYTHLQYWAGDNEVGAFFRAGTTEVVALVGDQEIYQCTVYVPTMSEDPCADGPTATEALVLRTLEANGVSAGMRLSFDEWDLYSQFYEGTVSFADALDAAIQSFIEDGDDIESPRSILLDADDDPECPQEDLADRVRCYMSRSDSHLAIVHDDIGNEQPRVYPPENGESIAEYWIFFLEMDRLSDHFFWAIVDRNDVSNVRNYGFN